MGLTDRSRLFADRQEVTLDLVTRGALEIVELAVAVALAVVDEVHLEPQEYPLEPVLFDVGHVSHESEQRQGRRFASASAQLLFVQSGALDEQCPAVVVEEGLEQL